MYFFKASAKKQKLSVSLCQSLVCEFLRFDGAVKTMWPHIFQPIVDVIEKLNFANRALSLRLLNVETLKFVDRLSNIFGSL